MEPEKFYKLIKAKGVAGLKEWKVQNPGKKIDLRGLIFEGFQLPNIDLNDALLMEANFKGANLHNATFDRANISLAIFENADLQGSHFNTTICIQTNFKQAKLMRTIFENSHCDRTNFERADLSNAKFLKANVKDSNFHLSNMVQFKTKEGFMKSCDFLFANITSSTFQSTILDLSDFTNAALTGSKFSFTSLNNVCFLNAKMNLYTKFEGITVAEDCKILKNTLDDLDRDYGGLETATRKQMDILDDFATLRNSFGGFWTFIHLVALSVFLSPYILFLGRCYLQSNPDNKGPTVLSLLGEYIYTSGQMDGKAHKAIIVTLLLLLYNISRFILLRKTKILELKQEISGLPLNFTFTPGWKFWYNVSYYGFWINVILVILHSVEFLMQRMPQI